MNEIPVFNIPDLVYDTAHDFPGGVPALAQRMGMSAKILNNKVKQTVDTHHTTVNDAVKMIDITGDDRIAHGFAALVGGIIVKLADFDNVSDMALLETYTKLMAEFGDFGKDFHATLTDGKITRAEFNKLKEDLYRLHSAAHTLLGRVESLIDE